jgi:hypothetical protein
MNNESEFFTGISKHSKTMYENKSVKRVFSYIVLECLDIPVSRGAPDSAFSYPTGYRICRIFEKYPARISCRIPDISVDKAQPFFAGWILELHNKWGLVTIF